MKAFKLIPSAVLAVTLSPFSQAIELKDAVATTLVNNPDIQIKLHQFKGAQDEKQLGFSEFLPSIDLNYRQGEERYITGLNTAQAPGLRDRDPSFWSVSVEATQNLFKGFQSVNLVRKLDHSKLAQYYALLDVSEQQSLEAGRAYLDVIRYRQLVTAAEADLEQHRYIHDKIAHRARSGAGRLVDLEQAAARLALAESNLLTEQTNLRDVSARFKRIVGHEPPAEMTVPSIQNPVASASDWYHALDTVPAYLSAKEQERAAKYEVKIRRGAFMPTLDAFANYRESKGSDQMMRTFFLDNQKEKTSRIEILARFNLFRGGADKARLGMAAEAFNSASDYSNKVCKESYQTLNVAMNDVNKWNEQIKNLRHHTLAAEKVRNAYLSLFDIGQISLLTLLDSERELFSATRQEINGKSEQTISYLRALAARGQLLESLSLKAAEHLDVKKNVSPDDALGRCSEQLQATALDRA